MRTSERCARSFEGGGRGGGRSSSAFWLKRTSLFLGQNTADLCHSNCKWTIGSCALFVPNYTFGGAFETTRCPSTAQYVHNTLVHELHIGHHGLWRVVKSTDQTKDSLKIEEKLMNSNISGVLRSDLPMRHKKNKYWPLFSMLRLLTASKNRISGQVGAWLSRGAGCSPSREAGNSTV